MGKTSYNLLESLKTVHVLPEGYRLHITWTDGMEAEVDLAEHIHRFAVAAPLRDPERFSSARIGPEGFTVDFGDDLEIPGDMLRRMALEAAGQIMPVRAFKEWRSKNGLSLSETARALGINRRTVSYYESGRNPIPRTIMLACIGWETLQGRDHAA